MGVSFPVAGLMVYCQIALGPVTYALLPSGAIVIISGLWPAATVCTGLALSAPVAGLMRNTETVSLLVAWPHLAVLPLRTRQSLPLVM